MSTEQLATETLSGVRPSIDPWPYGWRETSELQPDGSRRRKQVPLTLEDVLHPQEGDVIVETPVHDQDGLDLKNSIQFQIAERPELVLLHDCRVDWGISGLGAHSPDIVVFANGADWDPYRGTYYVREQQAKPLFVIEVTSPSTRSLDLDNKVVDYFRAGVPLYIIVDRQVVDEERGIRLLAYEVGARGYVSVPLNEQGRVWLEPVRLWLGTEGLQLRCFDEQGKRLATYLEAAQQRDAETQRADDAEAKAQAETEARLLLEAKVRELEARLRGQEQP